MEADKLRALLDLEKRRSASLAVNREHWKQTADAWKAAADAEAARVAELERENAALRTLAQQSRRDHYTCEDPWYSCAASEGEYGCSNDSRKGLCDCGADMWNAKVDAALAAQTKAGTP